MKSKFLTLNVRDFFKGLIVAILTAVLIFLQTVIVDAALLDWKAVFIKCGWTAIAATIAYLLKNLATNSKGEILTPEPK